MFPLFKEFSRTFCIFLQTVVRSLVHKIVLLLFNFQCPRRPFTSPFFRPAPSDSLRSISRNFSFVNTFFHFFEKSFFACRFAQVLILSTRSSNSLRIIPRIFSFVNTFFHLFEKSSLLVASLKSLFFRPAPFDSLRFLRYCFPHF